MCNTYNKHEKLKSKKLIEKLFTEGQTVSSYPLRLVFIGTVFEDSTLVKTGVSVSKKHFKNAVDRNRIKRLLREAYRLNKNNYFNNNTTAYAFMILYIGNKNPNYQEINTAMLHLFKKFSKAISKEI